MRWLIGTGIVCTLIALALGEVQCYRIAEGDRIAACLGLGIAYLGVGAVVALVTAYVIWAEGI